MNGCQKNGERVCLSQSIRTKGTQSAVEAAEKNKLISHTMKVWIIIKNVESRLRDKVEISTQKYEFMPGKKITDAMFALTMLMKKYREGQRELNCVFVDLQNLRCQGSRVVKVPG